MTFDQLIGFEERKDSVNYLKERGFVITVREGKTKDDLCINRGPRSKARKVVNTKARTVLKVYVHKKCMYYEVFRLHDMKESLLMYGSKEVGYNDTNEKVKDALDKVSVEFEDINNEILGG